MQQAARVSDYTAYMYLGELVEFDQTDTIFTQAAPERDRGLHHRTLRLMRTPAQWSHAMSDHTSKQFDAEMEAIRSGVLSMGGLVERQMSRALGALEQDEDARLIDAVGADEREINQLQIAIDQQCAQIIARRQPTAVDLRLIMTVTKVVNDLERIGDEIKKVAYKAAGIRGSDRLTRIRYYELVRTWPAVRSRCCAWRWTRSRASTSTPPRKSSRPTTTSTSRSTRSCAS